jgi:hydantoinase/carbamoylase family amidase
MVDRGARMRTLRDDMESLAAFGGDGPGVTRLAWSPELLAAYDWLGDRCRELGLDAEVDAAGNLLARWDAGTGPAVLVGSHLDTVPQGGRFDGALGVMGGLHAVRLLKQWGVEPRRPVWLAAFMDEENTRFNTALFGSRAFCGEDLGGLGDRRDADDVTLAAAMAAWGCDPDRHGEARRIGEVGHYLELHVEQGPRLEASGTDIGVVTSIVGLVGYRVRLTGRANHAGTTPMPLRRDALAGAARMVLAVRDEARRREDATANVGVIRVAPGSSNVIPGLCELSIDLRAPSAAAVRDLDEGCRAALAAIADEEGLGLELTEAYRVPPAPMAVELVELIERAAGLEGASAERMPSGAGHDAMVLAARVPAGMLLVPSRGGVSHSPEEYSSPEHCELGARVLARAVASLVS